MNHYIVNTLWTRHAKHSPPHCFSRKKKKSTRKAEVPYECGEAASAGGDLELAIEVSDGSGGEEALDQQQHSKHKESSCQAVDDVLQDADAVETTRAHAVRD